MRKFFVLFILVLAGAADLVAQPVTVKITADNFYAVYTGTAAIAGLRHFTGSWPNVMTPGPITPPPGDNFIYVVAWDDGGTFQGLLATVAVGAGLVPTGSPLWTVCATNKSLASNAAAAPTPGSLTTAIAACNSANSWRATSNGPSNSNASAAGLWSNVLKIDGTAKWIWADNGSAQCAGVNGFLKGSCNPGEYLIFRLSLKSDVRTRDNTTDAGAEPHTAGVIWNSPDIRLCTTAGCTADQNPDFGNPAYIYVTLTNGPPAQSTSGTLFVYYTSFGGAAQWNPVGSGNVYGDWNLINPGGTAVSLPAGQANTVVTIPWNTVPAPGHYCLLTRWVSAQDPMTFPEVAQTTTNVQNNNNISWKNFNVVDVLAKMSATSEFVVRNVDAQKRNIALELQTDGNVVADGNVLTIRLGDLFARWRDAGAKGRNVVVQAPDLVRLTGTPAAILEIPMDAGESAAIEVAVQARAPVPHPGTSHAYQVTLTQSTGGAVLGGATYTLVTRAQGTDTDGDGVPDVKDLDDDGDGVPDAQDADPVDSTIGRKGPAECMIDLARNRHTCGGIPGLDLIASPAQGKALVKLTLDPATSGFERAVFTVEFGTTPSGWSLNIGDSISNDGHGGDAGNQTYSAEVQILEKDLSIFANDLLLSNPLRLALVENVAGGGKAIQVEVADGFVGWKSPGVTGQLHSPYLFGLNGQRDAEGPTNRDIYAAFNRTISGRADRTGTGVRRVKIQLIPPPPKAPVKTASGAPAASPGS